MMMMMMQFSPTVVEDERECLPIFSCWCQSSVWSRPRKFETSVNASPGEWSSKSCERMHKYLRGKVPTVVVNTLGMELVLPNCDLLVIHALVQQTVLKLGPAQQPNNCTCRHAVFVEALLVHALIVIISIEMLQPQTISFRALSSNEVESAMISWNHSVLLSSCCVTIC